MAVEKEVKFKLEYLPKEAVHGERISQVYIIRKIIELRARKSNVNLLTVKTRNTSGKRLEFEFRAPLIIFNFFWKLGKDKVSKTRFKIVSNGNIWEVDLLDSGLIIAECEYETLPPACPWPGVDVTNDPEYYNSNIGR